MDAVRTPWERRAVALHSPCSRRHQRWRSNCALTALSPRAHRALGDHSALPLRPHGVPSALSSERRAVAEPRRACFATKLARRHSAFYAIPPRLHCDFRALMAIPLRGRCDACALYGVLERSKSAVGARSRSDSCYTLQYILTPIEAYHQ